MRKSTFAIMLYRDETERMSLDEIAEAAGLHPDLVERFVEFGVVEPAEVVGGRRLFDCSAVPRLHALDRLRRDVGANVPSAAIILDLADRIRALERELERLRHMGGGG